MPQSAEAISERVPGRLGAAHPGRVVVPAVLALIVQMPLAGFLVARSELGGASVLALITSIIGPLALLGARRWPGPVVAICAAAEIVELFAAPFALLPWAPSGPPPLALAFAVVSAIVRRARLWAFVSLAGAGIAVLVVLLIGVDLRPGPIIGASLALLLAAGVAEGIRTRRERIQVFRRAVTERRMTAEQAERVRIARELHDVLAHSLSSIHVQAGVGLHLMDSEPDAAAKALAAIREASKTALDEVRSVLNILRSDGEEHAPLRPEPDLSRLEELFEIARVGGVDVSLSNGLSSPPGRTLQLAIYRIVQESLTNVVRHAGASKAVVALTENDGELSVRVENDGKAAEAGHHPLAGRGLLGMRERAELLGGTLSAGPTDAGFRVLAIFPQRSQS